jgi:hypothetical protein
MLYRNALLSPDTPHPVVHLAGVTDPARTVTGTGNKTTEFREKSPLRQYRKVRF